MAIVNGEWSMPTVGSLHNSPKLSASSQSAGAIAVLSWVAESDSGGASPNPCFKAVSPTVGGWPIRLSAWPVAGYEPTTDFTLTITDEHGSAWSVTIDKDGDDNFLSNPYPPLMLGKLTVTCSNFGATATRMRFALFFSDFEPGISYSAAVFDDLSPLTTRGDLIYRGETTAQRLAVGTSGKILQSDGTDPGWVSTLGIANGGTGQTTATNAFDALAPTTTQGDIIQHNGSNNARLAKGTAGQLLRMNSGATAPEWGTVRQMMNTRDSTVFQNTDRAGVVNNLAVTSGTLYLLAISLNAGDTVTALKIYIASGAVTPTNWWYVLCNSSRVVVAVTADQLTTATGTGQVSLNLASPYLCTASGPFFAGFMFAAGTGPTVVRSTTNSTNIGAESPIIASTSTTGMTTPPSVTDTMGALTAITQQFWIAGT